jgi:hypothetical protein
MAVCIQVLLLIGVAILNSIGAYFQEWPTAYQLMNIPHFFMYIALIYYLCTKEFHTVAWVVLSLITLAAVDFMILSKKIFGFEAIVMDRLGGNPPRPPCGCKSGSVGCGCKSGSVGCGCKSGSVGCGCKSGSVGGEGNSAPEGVGGKSSPEGGVGGYPPPVMRMIGRPPMTGIQGDTFSHYPLSGAHPTLEETIPYPMSGLAPRPAYGDGGAAPTPPY